MQILAAAAQAGTNPLFGGPVLIGLGMAVVVGAILLFAVIGIYNKLVQLRVGTQNGFSQIDVQLKRRYDLIPNLVETAKGYMAHERQTLEAVISARNQAAGALQRAHASPGDAAAMRGLSQADGELGGALGRLMVTFEAYPDLKANQNMMQLTEELTTTENKVSFARQAYNDAVDRYNRYKQQFPTNVVAGVFGHGKDGEFFRETDAAVQAAMQQAPKVSFN